MLLLAMVTLVGLILAIKPHRVAEAMAGVELWLLLVAALLYLLNVVLKATRWRQIVTTTKTDISYARALRLFLCGLAVNNTSPGGVGGEPVRALLLRHENDVPTGEGLATIFGERLMDLTILMALSVCGLWFLLPELKPEEGYNMVLSLGLLVMMLVGLLVLALHPVPLRWLIARFKPRDGDEDRVGNGAAGQVGTNDVDGPGSGEEGGGLRRKLVGLMHQFQTGLEQLRSRPRTAAVAMGLTAAIWLNASLRFGVLVLAVTGDVKAAGLIFLAAGVVYSVGQFLPLGVGNIAVATLVLAAADVAGAQAVTIGILEVATSLTLSVPLGMGAMAMTGLPDRDAVRTEDDEVE